MRGIYTGTIDDETKHVFVWRSEAFPDGIEGVRVFSDVEHFQVVSINDIPRIVYQTSDGWQGVSPSLCEEMFADIPKVAEIAKKEYKRYDGLLKKQGM